MAWPPVQQPAAPVMPSYAFPAHTAQPSGGGGSQSTKLRVRISTGSTTGGGWQKIPFNTVITDTDSIWNAANTRAIPTQAGYYLVTGRFRTASAVTAACKVYKNGAAEAPLGPDMGVSSLVAAGGTALVYCNGTTDYIEIYAATTGTSAYDTTQDQCQFQVLGPF